MCKNKGVFTIPSITDKPTKPSQAAQTASPTFSKEGNPNKTPSSESKPDNKTNANISHAGLSKSTTKPAEINMNHNAEVREQAKALGLGKPWTKAEIVARAKELLKLQKEDLDIPDSLFMGAKGQEKERIKTVLFEIFQHIMTELAAGKAVDFFTDGDGTMFYKNPIMVASTSSQASEQDRHWNTILAQFLYFLGTKLSILTARPGIVAGQSIVGTEDPVNNAQNPNRVSLEEISSCVGERGEMEGFNTDTFGLSGGVTSYYGEPLIISEPTRNFMKLINFCSQPGNVTEKGFLQEFLDLRYNDGDSIRTCEFKALPQAFLLIPGLSNEQYHRYMSLAGKARKESWTAQKFVNEVNKLNINFPQNLKALLNPNDVESEMKLTEILRDGAQSIMCFTPHAIDGTNIFRDDIRAKLYDLLFKYTRSEAAQKWAEENLGIPKGTDLVTVNKKDVSSIKNFSEIKDLKKFIDKDHKELKEPKHKHSIINIIDNNQFYIEISPWNTKDEVIKRYQEAQDKNIFSVFRGDSRGSDAPAEAQAVISGGMGVIARGLMNKRDVAEEMVNLLAKEDNGVNLNHGHPFCLKDLGDKKFQRVSTGEIKTKSQWTDELLSQYGNKIHQIDNIHLTNAIFAYTFQKFFEKEKIPFDLPESKQTATEGPVRYRTLATPDIGFAEKGLEKYFPQPVESLESKLGFLKAIPFVGPKIIELLKIDNSRPVMTRFLSFLSQTLMISGGVGAVGSLVGQEGIAKKAKVVQRVASILNNFGSGITRGLRSPTRFPAQFLGEICSLASNCFPSESYPHKMLWATANGLLQLGRAGGTIQAENVILDKYKAGTEKEVEAAFGDQKEFSNIRDVGEKFTKSRTAWIMKCKPFMGQLLAETVADVVQGLKMTYQWLTVKGYRKGSVSSFFTKSGLTKTSMTSGKDYTNVASVSHQYSASGMFAIAATMLSAATHKLKIPGLDYGLTAIANILPTFGMMTAARHVEQDAHGHMRLFTDTEGRQGQFNPESAGWWQRIGVWGQALGGLFHKSTIGQLGIYAGLGAYLQGISKEFNPILELGAINTKRKTAAKGERFTSYFDSSNDFKKPQHIVEHTKKFYGRDKEFSSKAAEVKRAHEAPKGNDKQQAA